MSENTESIRLKDDSISPDQPPDGSAPEYYPWVDKHGDYALVPVPKHETKRVATILFVYMATVVDVAEIWGGGALGSQFTLSEIIYVTFVGSAILAILGSLLAYIGSVTRCSTYVNFRRTFGVVGSNIFSTVGSAIPNMGWFAINAWLFGVIMQNILPDAAFCQVFPATVWGGALMVLTAYIGIKGLAFFSYLAVPFFVLLAAFGLMIGIDKAGSVSEIFTMVPAAPVSIGEGITEVVGMMMALCIITADICRYGKYRWSGPVAWSAAMMLQVVLLVGASIFTLATGESDVPGALMAAGLGLGAFFMVVLGQWSTNQSNIYCSSLAVSMLLPIKRKNIVLILGVFGVGLAGLIASIWGNAMEPFQKFISLVGTIMPAIAGVVIADFYLMCPYAGKVKVEERYKSHPGMKLAKVNWLGWLAMAVGTVVGGFVIDFGIPAVNTLLLSLAVYSVLFIVCDKLNIPTGLGEHTVTETGE